MSTNGLPIIAAMRVIHRINGMNASYAEIAGYPVSKLTHTFYFPWYNNLNFDTELRISNP